MKRRRRRGGENEERGGSERGSLGRNRHERKAREEFWLRKPRRQMRTSERGYVVEGTARRQLLFSSCLPSREPPSFSSCPAVSPWNVHRRTSRCNLPYETCTYTCIHRAHILSPFLPRNTRTRVSFRISSGISPSFVRIRKSSTVQRLVFLLDGNRYSFAPLQISRFYRSKFEMAESSDKEK